MWSAAPKTFDKFWGLVESCQPLQQWFKQDSFDRRWLHALLYHLGQMFESERLGHLRPQRIRTGKAGQPPHVRSDDPYKDFELSMCVLSLILMGLLGPCPMDPREEGPRPKHWQATAMLLRHFFPNRFLPKPAGGTFGPKWDRENLRGRVNHVLRGRKSQAREGLLTVLTRVLHVTSTRYRRAMTAHLAR